MKLYTFIITVLIISAVQTQAENGKPFKQQHLSVLQSAKAIDSLPRLKPTFSFSNTFSNSYMWRGLVFNEGLMLQPSATVGYGHFELNGWSNVAAIETGGHEFVPEIDFNLGYTYEAKNYGVKPQANFYFYPANWQHISTLELGVEAFYEIENLGFYINPNVDVADNYGGVYVDYGIYKSGDLSKRVSYDARMLLGWGNKRFCEHYQTKPESIETNVDPKRLLTQDLKSMRLQLTADYQVSERFSIQPQLVAFRNFMLGYAFDKHLVRANASVTCSYAF